MIQAAITTETFIQTETERSGWKKTSYNRVINSDSDVEKTIRDEVQKAVGRAMESFIEKNSEVKRPWSSKSSAQPPDMTEYERRSRKREDDRTQRCFYCDQPGHFARNCRKKQEDERRRN